MTDDEAKLLRSCERKRHLDELRYRYTRQGAFEESFLHLGHPLFPGGRALEASDGGAAAAAIGTGLDPTPEWLVLWRRSYAKLPPKAKRIARALMEDPRLKAAARRAGVSRNMVKRWRRRLVQEFGRCHDALNQPRGGITA